MAKMEYRRWKPLRVRGLKVKAPRNIPDIVGRPVYHEPRSTICTRKDYPGETGGLRRPCHHELRFLPEGVVLRVCESPKKEGFLIPVSGYQDANAKSRALCRCQEEGKNAKACAVEHGWKGQLGRARRRRRRH